MSNALAIAGVTAVLKDLLNDGLINTNLDALGALAVSSSPPDQLEPTNGGQRRNQLNIFMWNATRNVGWSNERLPARDGDGNRVDSPYLALDLHFMLTATGENDLNAEILLGYGMQILHETPVLTRDAIRTALGVGGPVEANILPPTLQFLVASDLADQLEQLRITPSPMDPEMIYNLWSAFSAPLRASALYQVTCVLIESRTPVRSSLPVLTIGRRTAQLRRPTIALIRVLPNGPGTLPAVRDAIRPGSWIAIDGHALATDLMRISLDRQLIPVLPVNASNGRVEVELPADIQPGIAPVQIEHLFVPEGGGTPRLWEASNVSSIVVSPILTSQLAIGAAVDGLFSGSVTATMAHTVGATQSVAFLFNPADAATPDAFSIRASARTADGSTVSARLIDVPVGSYLLRIEIDGAQTELSLDANGFNGPIVVLGP